MPRRAEWSAQSASIVRGRPPPSIHLVPDLGVITTQISKIVIVIMVLCGFVEIMCGFVRIICGSARVLCGLVGGVMWFRSKEVRPFGIWKRMKRLFFFSSVSAISKAFWIPWQG